MTKQKGFTLIELLLVLAIIGIISAIAVPALLSQRARARDKAAISNLLGRINDLAGQYDKAKEGGSKTIAADLGAYLGATSSTDRNPWNSAEGAFQVDPSVATAITLETITGSTLVKAEAAIKAKATVLGRPVFGLIEPAAIGGTGFLAGAVKTQNAQTDGTPYVIKVVNVE